MHNIEPAKEKDSPKTADQTQNCLEALSRMHDDINFIHLSDKSMEIEMSRVSVVCYPPPISPPCQLVELAPDPSQVNRASDGVNFGTGDLIHDFNDLRGAAERGGITVPATKLAQQLQEMSFEISRMNLMTLRPNLNQYDKPGILVETDKIDRLCKTLDQETSQIEKSLAKR